MVMSQEVVFFLLVNIFILLGAGLLKRRHILRFLLLLEIGLLLRLLILGELCPFGWQYLRVVLLVIGVGEAGLGLSVVVKVSRSKGEDRFSLGALAAN